MATKKKTVINEYSKNIPMTLDDHPFFGIIPDKEQKALMDEVWKREKRVFLVDSIAGSGKTLIATALGVLMVQYGIYDKIVYIIEERKNKKWIKLKNINLRKKNYTR